MVGCENYSMYVLPKNNDWQAFVQISGLSGLRFDRLRILCLTEFEILYLIIDLLIETISLSITHGRSSVCEAYYGVGRTRTGGVAAGLIDLVFSVLLKFG